MVKKQLNFKKHLYFLKNIRIFNPQTTKSNIMERIKEIINNVTVGKVMYNLYDRWLDESEYEDINEYGKAIVNSIHVHLPHLKDVSLIKATKRPFGVKLQVGDKKAHIFTKIKGNYVQLCAKMI
jgi:hypothetical protein